MIVRLYHRVISSIHCRHRIVENNKQIISLFYYSVTPVTLGNGTIVITNSTMIPNRSKFPLAMILGLVFGSLGVVILVTSIIFYILVKQGYINVFNSPRTRLKDTNRSQLGDSSSSIGGSSSTRR